MFTKIKEHILIYKRTYNDHNLLKIYKGIKYCKKKQCIKEIAEFLETVEIGDFNIANSIVNELNMLVFGNENRDEEIRNVIKECETVKLEDDEIEEDEDIEEIIDELEKRIVSKVKSNNVEIENNERTENNGRTEDNERIENNRRTEDNVMSQNTIETENNEIDITNHEQTKHVAVNDNTNENLKIDDSVIENNNGIETKEDKIENTNIEIQEQSNNTLQNASDADDILCRSVVIDILCDVYDDFYFHTALSYIVKPLLNFKAKECVNMLIHLAHKTDTRVMHTLLKDNKHWCIEILLHIAQINKKQSKSCEEELKEAKELLTEMINNLFECQSTENSTYKKFVCQMAMLYLGIEFDSFLYASLKRIVNENDSQINIAVCVSLCKIVTEENIANGSVIEIFNMLEGQSNAVRYSLSVQFEFYKAFKTLPDEIYSKYLSWVFECMSETITDHIFCDHVCLEAITSLFVIFCQQFKTREMYIILFFIIAQKGDVLYKRCLNILTANLRIIQTHLFDNNGFHKNALEIDFNKLNTPSVIDELTEQMNAFSFESTVHDIDLYAKMLNCRSVPVKENFYGHFNEFVILYTSENSDYLNAFINEIDVLRNVKSETRNYVFDYLMNLQLMWREEKKVLEFLIKNEDLFIDKEKYFDKFGKSRYYYVRMMVNRRMVQRKDTK